MIISRNRYGAELHARWVEAYQYGHERGLNEGREEMIKLLRDSKKIEIVHGSFIVESKSTLEDCTVIVIPSPPNAINVIGGKGTVIKGNTVFSK